MNLTDKQKGIALSLIGVLVITPDSLLIRLISMPSWELLFYRGLIPFIFLLILLLLYYCWWVICFEYSDNCFFISSLKKTVLRNLHVI